jgi:hypothetical protein
MVDVEGRTIGKTRIRDRARILILIGFLSLGGQAFSRSQDDGVFNESDDLLAIGVDHHAMACGGGVRRHAPQDSFELSPSGRYLAAQLSQRWMNELALFDLETGEAWVLRHPDPQIRLAEPDFAPDETSLAFTVSPSPHGVGEIWITGLRGDLQARIADFGRMYQHPTFDRSGRRLAYFRDVAFDLELGRTAPDYLANRGSLTRSLFYYDLDIEQESQIYRMATGFSYDLFWSDTEILVATIAYFHAEGVVNNNPFWRLNRDVHAWRDEHFEFRFPWRFDLTTTDVSGPDLPSLLDELPESATLIGRFESRLDYGFSGPAPMEIFHPENWAHTARVEDIVEGGPMLVSYQPSIGNPRYVDPLYLVDHDGPELIDWGRWAPDATFPGSIDVYYARLSDEGDVIAARNRLRWGEGPEDGFEVFRIRRDVNGEFEFSTLNPSDPYWNYQCFVLNEEDAR